MNQFAGYVQEVPMGYRAMLPSEMLRALLRYDAESGKLYWRPRVIELYPSGKRVTKPLVDKWNREFAGKEAFTAVGSHGYRVGRIFDRLYLAHRVIFTLVTGNTPEFIDHIDGDRLNNRWINLRSATKRDNQRNMKRPSHNTSGHIGIRKREDCDRWLAQITNGPKTIHLGLYKTRAEAIAARKAAEKVLGFHRNHGR